MKHLRHASLAAALVLAAAACADQPTSDPVTPDFAHNKVGDAAFGTTGGWAAGKDVEFFYRKDFFCRQPPASGATSGCELGEEPITAPRGGKIPVVYVMTPLGIEVPNATLHCPEVGNCINHPSTLDVSRVFGVSDATLNFPLPAHSHIVEGPGDLKAGQAGWWEIEVIGVTDRAVWDEVVAGKSLARVRELQAAGTGITGDIPSNLYLFFGVRPK